MNKKKKLIEVIEKFNNFAEEVLEEYYFNQFHRLTEAIEDYDLTPLQIMKAMRTTIKEVFEDTYFRKYKKYKKFYQQLLDIYFD